MTSRLGIFLDWTVIDFIVLGILIWQYISVSADLRRTRAREAAEQSAARHPEGE